MPFVPALVQPREGSDAPKTGEGRAKNGHDIIDIIAKREIAMASLLVRGVDEALVQTLREVAAAHGRSAEAEHREILARALRRPIRKSLAEVLMSIPDVGKDADFQRVNDAAEGPGVLG